MNELIKGMIAIMNENEPEAAAKCCPLCSD
jgi:hypothetical protein